MAKLLRCRDVGFDCEAEVRADTDAEILDQVARHAREVHGLEDVSDEVVAKVLSVITTEHAAT
jgi:predicted small metal-binding protein